MRRVLIMTLVGVVILVGAPIGSLSVAAIKVSDLEQSLKFYTEVLGFLELYRYEFEGRQCVELENFRLVGPKPDSEPATAPQPSKPQEIGLFYLLLDVDDIEATVKILEGKGVQFLMPVTEAGGAKFTFFLDPDGVSIMLEQKQY